MANSAPDGSLAGSERHVRVTVVASKPLRSQHHTFEMFADFGEGLRYSVRAGANQLRIPPGRYRLRMYSQLSWWRVAKAELTVGLRAEPVTIYYATPYTIFPRGAIGLVPQRRPFLAMLALLLAGAAVAALAGYVIGLLTS
jgi:hypothetical protein